MVALGSLVGSVALRPNSPLTAVVIATVIIFLSALVIDAGHAWGIIPGFLLHPTPTLLFVDGEYNLVGHQEYWGFACSSLHATQSDARNE